MSILRTWRAACPGGGEGFTSRKHRAVQRSVTHSESIWGMYTQSPEDGDRDRLYRGEGKEWLGETCFEWLTSCLCSKQWWGRDRDRKILL